MVIDTNVFRAAGETEATDSTAARELLETLRVGRHQIAWCDELDREFWKHTSKFSATWVTQMVSRGRRVDCKLENSLHLPCQECGFTENEKTEAEKDRFLLDLALKVDRLIASFERHAPALFRRLATKNMKIRKIGWAHPWDDRDDLSNWLTQTKFTKPDGWYLKPVT